MRSNKNYNPAEELRQVKIVDGLIRWLFEPLRYVDGAATSKVPWSLVQPLQTFSQKFVPNIKIIVRPKWRYNYSVLMADLIECLSKPLSCVLSKTEVDNCFAELKAKLHIISFPFIERKSILLHAAFAHEIGHCTSFY